MGTSRAGLSSLATSLDELTQQVTAAADAMDRDEGDLAADLYEVERSLRTARRRLDAVLRRL